MVINRVIRSTLKNQVSNLLLLLKFNVNRYACYLLDHFLAHICILWPFQFLGLDLFIMIISVELCWPKKQSLLNFFKLEKSKSDSSGWLSYCCTNDQKFSGCITYVSLSLLTSLSCTLQHKSNCLH